MTYSMKHLTIFITKSVESSNKFLSIVEMMTLKQTQKLKGFYKDFNQWLWPKCHSIQRGCIAFTIDVSRSGLLNMGLQQANVCVSLYLVPTSDQRIIPSHLSIVFHPAYPVVLIRHQTWRSVLRHQPIKASTYRIQARDCHITAAWLE